MEASRTSKHVVQFVSNDTQGEPKPVKGAEERAIHIYQLIHQAPGTYCKSPVAYSLPTERGDPSQGAVMSKVALRNCYRLHILFNLHSRMNEKAGSYLLWTQIFPIVQP